MTDCLIIGFNDANFEEYVKLVASMGKDSGAYRDLDLAFIKYNNKPYRSMDILDHFYHENSGGTHRPFSNVDFLWPVVTYLGTYLTKANLSFDYVNLFHLEKDRLKEKLLKNDILTIAITTTLYVSPHPILEVISFIRQYNQTARIVVGGPFIGNQPKLLEEENMKGLFRSIGADFYIISQEGETALVNLIKALKSGSSLDAVANLAYRNGDDYVMTGSIIESNPLEENMIRYNLFPREGFGEFVTLRTAKSCPFSCSFCGFPQRAGKYKYLSVEHVEQELNAIREIGTVTTLSFIDDTFNVPKERFKEMLRMMIRNNYGFKWNSFYRSDQGDEETIELMGKAGCEGVFLGIESGSDRMLEKMRKTSKRKDYMRAIPLLRDAGISMYASLIFGFPGETHETIAETMDLINQAKPDYFRAQLWYCDPVTPIWDEREKYGIKGSAFTWSHDTMDSKTASDLIEKVFLSQPEENSIWLPQFGFEQWSTYYLQRKGMTQEQLKLFLRSFNAVVKEKLIDPAKKEISPDLLENLRTSCQFDRPARPDLHLLDIYSGSRYQAAERFWIETFDQCPDASSLEMIRRDEFSHQPDFALDERDATQFKVSPALAERLRLKFPAELSEVILAAYSVLLSRLSGRPETVIVVVRDDQDEPRAVPLRLNPSWGLSFKEFAEAAGAKLSEAMEHQLYAAAILTNPSRMREHGGCCPVFDVGYVYHRVEKGQPTPRSDELLKSYTAAGQEMSLIVVVEDDGTSLDVRLSYLRSMFNAETMEKVGSYLASILEEVGGNPAALLEELLADTEWKSSELEVDSYAGEAFNF
ncbi:MAG: PhpK family radical SAM P-methyltransferase [Pyrinomonadaceae bacterium]